MKSQSSFGLATSPVQRLQVGTMRLRSKPTAGAALKLVRGRSEKKEE
jgi:hypothetical protein